MTNRIGKGLAGLVLSAGLAISCASLPGCALGFTFKDGREKISSSAVAAGFVSGAEVKHEIYKNSQQDEIECAFDSTFSGNILGGGAYEMKISGENRKLLWMYRIESLGKRDGKYDYKLQVLDSEKNSSGWIYSVPDFLPAQVNVHAYGSSFSNLSGSIGYSNLKEERVNPRYLLSEPAMKFVRDTIKK